MFASLAKLQLKKHISGADEVSAAIIMSADTQKVCLQVLLSGKMYKL